MIYDIYFEGLHVVRAGFDSRKEAWVGFDTGKYLADRIKGTQAQDTYIFITTDNQEERMENYMDKHDLRDFLVFEMPRFIRNANTGTPDKLKVRIFQNKVQA